LKVRLDPTPGPHDILHNDIEHNDTWPNNKIATFSLTTLYAEIHLY